MADSFVQVAPNSTGAKIDNSLLIQDSGATVMRQRVTNGDPINVDSLQRTDAAGNSQTREAIFITEMDASQNLGTSPVEAIPSDTATLWIDMENISTGGQLIGYTVDGTEPGFTGGVPNKGTFVLTPWGTKTYDKRIPTGPLNVVGSAAGAVVTIKYA